MVKPETSTLSRKLRENLQRRKQSKMNSQKQGSKKTVDEQLENFAAPTDKLSGNKHNKEDNSPEEMTQ